MAELIEPSKFQEVVLQGFNRIKTYRRARAMFIRQFVGQYYADESGMAGEEPINLIFHAIRTLVPNIIMRNPGNEVTTDVVANEIYAELLSMGINSVEKRINLKDTLRAWLVDAIFAMGIIKVGISQSDNIIQMGDDNIDPGEIYAEIVDLDNFVFDPFCTSLRNATFIGDRVTIPRQMLLDMKIYDSDLVEKLPKISTILNEDGRVEKLSKKNMSQHLPYPASV